jgi:hypothetical protein
LSRGDSGEFAGPKSRELFLGYIETVGAKFSLALVEDRNKNDSGAALLTRGQFDGEDIAFKRRKLLRGDSVGLRGQRHKQHSGDSQLTNANSDALHVKPPSGRPIGRISMSIESRERI